MDPVRRDDVPDFWTSTFTTSSFSDNFVTKMLHPTHTKSGKEVNKEEGMGVALPENTNKIDLDRSGLVNWNNSKLEYPYIQI